MRIGKRILSVCGALLMWGTLCLGQGPAPAPVPAAPTGADGVLIRPLWTEILITAIMVGFVLFAVCRKSNRQ
ncbi:hypothetical protein AB1L42_17010 [Thalassoglobus sp. JC818]|uniref:hypothetical protein n=1 Tax=Thalassoglobus sp. JC818 TaxID=3232136 RepID=UPI003459B3FD